MQYCDGFKKELFTWCFFVMQDSQNLVVERREERPPTPSTMNAFELISTSQGLNLSSLFEKHMVRSRL